MEEMYFQIEPKEFKNEKGETVRYNQIVLVYYNEVLNKTFRFPIKCIFKENQKSLLNMLSTSKFVK